MKLLMKAHKVMFNNYEISLCCLFLSLRTKTHATKKIIQCEKKCCLSPFNAPVALCQFPQK